MTMTKLNRRYSLAFLVLGILALAPTAQAVPIFSGEGRGDCTMGETLGGGRCRTHEIEKHALWADVDPRGHGAVWVSYADTGVDGSTVAPGAITEPNPWGMSTIMILEETFEIGSLGGELEMWIWADDTARVFVDDFEWISPMWAQGTCAARAIGCESDEYGELALELAAGQHTLRIEAFQVGGGTTNATNPFGVLYSGEAISYGGGTVTSADDLPTSAMPEPTAALAFGMGLAALGLSRRTKIA